MKKLLFLLLVLVIAWGYQATENVASAHGGTYRGPSGEVPPGQRDPKDPQPPPEQPGPGTPPAGGPPTGGGEGPPTGGDDGEPETPKPGSPAPAPEPPSPGGIATPSGGGRRAQKPMSYENWLFWWNYNKDEILNLKAKIKAGEKKVSTRTSTHFFGEGADGNKGDTTAPTDAMIQSKIVPALQKVVADKNIHPDIRGGALIALARCGGGMAHVQTFFEVGKHDVGEDKVVQESAILALGILQQKNPEIRDFLVDLVNDTEGPFRARCFALLSLGFLQDNSPEVFDCIEARLDGSEATPDVPVFALLAIGLIGDNAKVPDLQKWLNDGRIGRNKLADAEKAHIVSALGRIGDPESLKTVFDTLRKKGQHTRRSAYIAAGQLIPQAEPKTQMEYLKKLTQYLKNESDRTAKNFGIVALGRIGGASGIDESVRTVCEKILVDEYKNGGRSTERPYAAMALGIMCFEGVGGAKPREMRYRIAKLIRDDLKTMKGDKISHGSNAIALGMIGDNDKETVGLLTKLLKDRGLEKKLRGACAVALGLIGDNAAKDAIISALKEREDRDLRVDTAVGAGLLSDPEAVEVLVNVVSDRKASQFVLGSVALALGQIGDSRAIESLIKILEPDKTNGTYPDLTRALVAVALGQLANRRDIRVLFRLSKDINYRASVSALDEALTIL